MFGHQWTTLNLVQRILKIWIVVVLSFSFINFACAGKPGSNQPSGTLTNDKTTTRILIGKQLSASNLCYFSVYIQRKNPVYLQLWRLVNPASTTDYTLLNQIYINPTSTGFKKVWVPSECGISISAGDVIGFTPISRNPIPYTFVSDMDNADRVLFSTSSAVLENILPGWNISGIMTFSYRFSIDVNTNEGACPSRDSDVASVAGLCAKTNEPDAVTSAPTTKPRPTKIKPTRKASKAFGCKMLNGNQKCRYNVGNKIEKGAKGAPSLRTGGSFILNNYELVPGYLCSFDAYFDHLAPVTFQLWKNPGEITIANFNSTLLNELELIPWSLWMNKVIPPEPIPLSGGEMIGFYVSNSNPITHIVSPHSYVYYSKHPSGPPSIGDNIQFDVQLFAYKYMYNADVVEDPSMCQTQVREPKFKECVTDVENDRDMTTKIDLTSNNSPATCGTYCANKNFTYFALENQNECRCGNSYGKHGATASPTACDATTCPGNSTETCGGTLAARVFETDIRARTTPEGLPCVMMNMLNGCPSARGNLKVTGSWETYRDTGTEMSTSESSIFYILESHVLPRDEYLCHYSAFFRASGTVSMQIWTKNATSGDYLLVETTPFTVVTPGRETDIKPKNKDTKTAADSDSYIGFQLYGASPIPYIGEFDLVFYQKSGSLSPGFEASSKSFLATYPYKYPIGATLAPTRDVCPPPFKPPPPSVVGEEHVKKVKKGGAEPISGVNSLLPSYFFIFSDPLTAGYLCKIQAFLISNDRVVFQIWRSTANNESRTVVYADDFVPSGTPLLANRTVNWATPFQIQDGDFLGFTVPGANSVALSGAKDLDDLNVIYADQIGSAVDFGIGYTVAVAGQRSLFAYKFSIQVLSSNKPGDCPDFNPKDFYGEDYTTPVVTTPLASTVTNPPLPTTTPFLNLACLTDYGSHTLNKAMENVTTHGATSPGIKAQPGADTIILDQVILPSYKTYVCKFTGYFVSSKPVILQIWSPQGGWNHKLEYQMTFTPKGLGQADAIPDWTAPFKCIPPGSLLGMSIAHLNPVAFLPTNQRNLMYASYDPSAPYSVGDNIQIYARPGDFKERRGFALAVELATDPRMCSSHPSRVVTAAPTLASSIPPTTTMPYVNCTETVTPAERIACGSPVITQGQCQIDRCCFDNSVSNAANCFEPQLADPSAYCAAPYVRNFGNDAITGFPFGGVMETYLMVGIKIADSPMFLCSFRAFFLNDNPVWLQIWRGKKDGTQVHQLVYQMLYSMQAVSDETIDMNEAIRVEQDDVVGVTYEGKNPIAYNMIPTKLFFNRYLKHSSALPSMSVGFEQDIPTFGGFFTFSISVLTAASYAFCPHITNGRCENTNIGQRGLFDGLDTDKAKGKGDTKADSGDGSRSNLPTSQPSDKETSAKETSADLCQEGTCGQFCDVVDSKPKCSCLGGYNLDVDLKNCIDINECNTIADCKFGTYCYNYEGGYTCLPEPKEADDTPYSKFDLAAVMMGYTKAWHVYIFLVVIMIIITLWLIVIMSCLLCQSSCCDSSWWINQSSFGEPKPIWTHSENPNYSPYRPTTAPRSPSGSPGSPLNKQPKK